MSRHRALRRRYGHAATASAKKAFVSYILAFYGPKGKKYDGLEGLGYFEGWGYAPMKRAEATRAATAVMARADYGDGDSLDRERARDVVLAWRGISLPLSRGGGLT
jgi:hypothetical protein